MKARLLWISCAVLGLIILLPVSISFYKDLMVFNKGRVVKVSILSKPLSLSTNSGYFKFMLANQMFDKRADMAILNKLHVGDSIELRFLKGYEGHSLFVDENPTFWGITVILIIIILVGWAIYYAINKTPPFN